MVESDVHTNKLVRGLEQVVAFDRIIRRTKERMKAGDTLILFTADHSFDLRVVGSAGKSEPLVAGADGPGQPVRSGRGVIVDGHHSAEEVLVSAEGPGAERVRGFLSNTDLFHVMMAAYGWGDPEGR